MLFVYSLPGTVFSPVTGNGSKLMTFSGCRPCAIECLLVSYFSLSSPYLDLSYFQGLAQLLHDFVASAILVMPTPTSRRSPLPKYLSVPRGARGWEQHEGLLHVPPLIQCFSTCHHVNHHSKMLRL